MTEESKEVKALKLKLEKLEKQTKDLPQIKELLTKAVYLIELDDRRRSARGYAVTDLRVEYDVKRAEFNKKLKEYKDANK